MISSKPNHRVTIAWRNWLPRKPPSTRNWPSGRKTCAVWPGTWPRAQNGDVTAISRLADLQEQVLSGERRATELTEAMVALRRQQVTPEELARVADLLDGLWESMSRSDQVRILRHLLERIDCEAGKITVTFNAAGIKALGEELAQQETNP